MKRRLGTRVRIERQTLGEDGYGNAVTGWAPLLEAWADLQETLGREVVAAGRIEAGRSATARLRASPATRGITPADRLIARGATWNIRSAITAGRKGELVELLIEEGGAA